MLVLVISLVSATSFLIVFLLLFVASTSTGRTTRLDDMWLPLFFTIIAFYSIFVVVAILLHRIYGVLVVI